VQFIPLVLRIKHSLFILNTPIRRNFESLLNPEQKYILDQYIRYLEGLRLSKSTVVTYRNFIIFLLLFWKDKPLTDLDNPSTQRFVELVVKRRNYGISTHRQLISALRHFGDRFTESGLDPTLLTRPYKSRSLPLILSKEEVIDLLRATYNLKHRTILALLYSCGLRISEVQNLRLADVDLDRRQLIVRQGKGRKDRYIVLAESTIPLLINYVSSCKPSYYVFHGAKGATYSASSIRAFLKRSCRRAGIRKQVTPHTLRHSYATHLIENGVNLRIVQELLGHSKPETTMIYTHVAKKDLLSVQSPLDRILLELRTTDKNILNKSISGNLKG
jgi:site-specific recombinase XerD